MRPIDIPLAAIQRLFSVDPRGSIVQKFIDVTPRKSTEEIT
jgi:hypothetical protein